MDFAIRLRGLAPENSGCVAEEKRRSLPCTKTSKEPHHRIQANASRLRFVLGSANYRPTALKKICGRRFCSRVESAWETITLGWRALCHVTRFGHPL